MEVLTWTCHICKETRPDDKISVVKHPLIIKGRDMGTENIRYCNDNPDCCVKAPNYSHFNKKS